jgi:alkaline phosphatase
MDAPKTLLKNTDIGAIVADVLGIDIVRLSRSLYVDLDTTHLSYTVNTTDVTFPHAVVDGYVFPLGFDFFLVDGKRHMIPGITVYAPVTGKLYISSAAIKTIESMMV